MLAVQYLELLTAYVDGELSARRQRLVVKLLKRSPEARALLQKLQSDSHDLLQLPPPPRRPVDVSAGVMQAIQQRGLRPGRKRRPVAGTVSLWRGVAAAAAVLLFSAGSTYLFFKEMGDQSRPATVARRQAPDAPLQANRDKPTPAPVEDGVAKKPPEERQPIEEPRRTPNETVVKEAPKVPDPEKPVLPEKPDPVIVSGAPSMDVLNPHEAEVALPTLLRLRDLNQEKPYQTLVKELGRHDGFYIELLCKEPTHALPRVQAGLQAGGVELLVDGAAQQRLKQPQLKTNYVVYLDNVTPEELAKLLQPLGQEDAKADKKKPAYGQFLSTDANLVVCPMGLEHRRKIVGYLGADPRQARATGPLGVDLTRPIAEQTADQLTGDRKTAERSALALVHGALPRSQSAEVKRYLDGHKQPRKGTLQVLLVLRARS